jgi:hypothetical protein
MIWSAERPELEGLGKHLILSNIEIYMYRWREQLFILKDNIEFQKQMYPRLLLRTRIRYVMTSEKQSAIHTS